MKNVKIVPFTQTLSQHRLQLSRRALDTLQVNVGKQCNQTCQHCHVDAGPKRKEIMERQTVERLLELITNTPSIRTVDITGGAPELNPHFRYLVTQLHALGKEVIDRCNLTVFFEKGQEDTAEFLRKHKVQIIASLPCYTKDNVDRQRGDGVFEKSITALKGLNQLGYGMDGSELQLHLVYNPVGAVLPGSQTKLELDYKRELRELFGIQFNRLFTITNMPIKRFLRDLERQGKLQEYMDLLVNNFNPHAAAEVMCTNLISVSWDGLLYDCDFNQMLDLGIGGERKTIWQIDNFSDLVRHPIALAAHCYGCTAGSGSSCGGSLV